MKNDDATQLGLQTILALLRSVRDLQEAVTHSTLVSSALVQALSEEMPRVAEKYARYLEESERSSPLAETSRQLVARLDGMLQQLASSSPEKERQR